MIHNSGLFNSKYIAGDYPLFETILLDKSVRGVFSLVENRLKGIANAKTKICFKNFYQQAFQVL